MATYSRHGLSQSTKCLNKRGVTQIAWCLLRPPPKINNKCVAGSTWLSQQKRTAYLVSGRLGVNRPRRGGHEGHRRRLGEVNRGVEGASRVDEGREDLAFSTLGGRDADGRWWVSLVIRQLSPSCPPTRIYHLYGGF